VNPESRNRTKNKEQIRTHHDLRITDHGSRITDHASRITIHALRITYHHKKSELFLKQLAFLCIQCTV